MAYPGNPPKGPAGFEKAPLTPDDFERLATSFRPSWDLDEAPFVGAGSLSTADIRALQGGGTRAEVRATTQAAANGSHAPPKATVGHEEPAIKVIVKAPSVPPPPVQSPPAERPKIVPSAGPWAAASAATAVMPPSFAPSAPAAQSRITTVRPPRPTLASEPAFPRPGSKTGLWVGVGAAALAVVGGIVWMASGGSGTSEKAALPEPAATIVPEKTPSIPPPPPEPVAVAPKAPVVAAPPVVAATALPQAPPAPPSQPAPHPVVMNAPAPHPVASPPPVAKPATASRPKGPTIVRDVPF